MRNVASRSRRPKWAHHIPLMLWGPPVGDSSGGPGLLLARAVARPFCQVVASVPGDTYWAGQIHDAIVGDAPLFRYKPPKKGCPFSVQQLVVQLAVECTESRGILIVEEVIDGLPTFAANFVATGTRLLCVWSTDATRAQPIDLAAYRKAGAAWLRSREETKTP